MRAIYLTLEKLIQPEVTQVNGIVILADYTGVGMSQASNPGPFLAKKVVSVLQVTWEPTHLCLPQMITTPFALKKNNNKVEVNEGCCIHRKQLADSLCVPVRPS